jgi:hypothetical protein
MNIFYAATKITVGNEAKTPFWEAPWLNGLDPKDIAPPIFMSSKRKKQNVKNASFENVWVAKINLTTGFTYDHIVQYVELWTQLQGIHLAEDITDDITWTLLASGQYSTTSSYKVQFFGAISTNMNKVVWKIWAPPKNKSLACALQ